MDKGLSKFDWNKARAFLVTVEEGSLSAGARALGTTQATLSRQVSSLEQELGIVLFERSGHSLVLTPSGAELAEYAKTMAEAAAQLSMVATGKNQTIEGTICISANEFDAALRLPPIFAKLRAQHPKINFEIVVGDNVSDLKQREADIALRWFEPSQNELISHMVGMEEVGFFASTDYLERNGEPETLAELSTREFIGFDSTVRLRNMLKPLGLQLTAENFPFLCDSYLVQREYALNGLAIGILPADIGNMHASLVRLIPDVPTKQYNLWLVTHREVNTNQRIKIVYDFMLQELENYFN